MNMITQFKLKVAVALVVFMASFDSHADLLELSHNPLFLDQSVPPAMAFTFDDSGSMGRSYMPDNITSAGGAQTANSFASSDFNTIYYNPNFTYSPPLDENGEELPSSNFRNASVNGYIYNAGGGANNKYYVDLADEYIPYVEYLIRNDGGYRIRYTSAGHPNLNNSICCDQRSDFDNNIANNNGTRAFYYQYTGDLTVAREDRQFLTDYDLVTLPAAQEQNFANWYTYYNNRNKLTKAAISRAFGTFGEDFKVAWQQLNNHQFFSPMNRFRGDHREDFFNWLFGVPGDGFTPLQNAFRRATALFDDENSKAYYSEEFDIDLSCQQNFHIAISDGGWNQINTNNANFDDNDFGGVPGDSDTLLTNYGGAGQQAIYPGPRRYSLADIAMDAWGRDLRDNLDNNVKPFWQEFTDAAGTTIELLPEQTPYDVPALQWNPKNDPAYWQHLVTFNVGLGVDGVLGTNCEANVGGDTALQALCATDPQAAVYQALRAGTANWPNVGNCDICNEPQRIDDVWHSSINSRGNYFSAKNPSELTEALRNVVNDITARKGRASATSVSSGIISSGSLAFQAGFDAAQWSGFILARTIDRNGNFGDVEWNAADLIPDPGNRNLYTFDPFSAGGARVEFTPSGVAASPYLSGLLEVNTSQLLGTSGRTVGDVVEFLRGDDTFEVRNGGIFRNRESLLGDIINSGIVVVRAPGERYRDVVWPDGSLERDAALDGNGYQDFQEDRQSRGNIILAGANDGMLHAFYANGAQAGEEIWGYIPSKAFENIHELARPAYSHRTYVDVTPSIRDVFFSDSWHSVIVGGQRYGGQSFYAIDITDTGAQAPNVLWEFTDQDDADLGYTYGNASIVRLTSIDRWVALLPNGFNSSEDDGNAGSGTAVLFVVDMENGNVIAKLDTGEGSATDPNGLSTPGTADLMKPDGTSGVDQGTDYVYAGDLYGNLWRFDLTSSDPGSWNDSNNIRKLIDADTPYERPITVQPRIFALPSDDNGKSIMVTVGTGKYLESADRSIALPVDQFMIGVKDGAGNSDFNIGVDELVEQTFSVNGGTRKMSNNEVDLTAPGWKIRLTEPGERMVNPQSKLSESILVFTTLIPNGEDPCLSGGNSWFMVVNPLTGGTPGIGSVITASTGARVDGVNLGNIVVGKPPVVQPEGGGKVLILPDSTSDPLSGNTGDSIDAIELPAFQWRRRGWTNMLTK